MRENFFFDHDVVKHGMGEKPKIGRPLSVAPGVVEAIDAYLSGLTRRPSMSVVARMFGVTRHFVQRRWIKVHGSQDDQNG